MASLKGKVKTTVGCSTRDSRTHRTVGVTTFKVCQDNENDTINVRAKKTSAPVKEGALATGTTDLMGNLRILQRTKGKQDSVIENVKRKPLADVSNVKSSFTVIDNIKRKPLADVSNVKSSFRKNLVSNNSKPKISLGAGSKPVNFTSRKPSLENLRKDLRENNVNTTKRGVKELATAYDNHRINTNNHGHKVLASNVRNTRYSFQAMRKSLPVLQRVNQENDICRNKENTNDSEKTNRSRGFLVKAKVVNKATRASNSGRLVWSNRVSDGFIIRGPSDQANMDGHILSKKITMPIVKTAFRTGKAHRNSGFKRISATSKPLSAAAIMHNNRETALDSALLQDNPVAVSCMVTQVESPSNCSQKSTAKTSEASKPNRRRSYTSFLLSNSKLLEKSSEAMKQGDLPSIDDNSNHLEVTQYIDDIYQYYWVLEAQNLPLANYMSIQTEITPQMRGILINWLIEVHYKFELMPETLYLMVTVLDRYLSQVPIRKSDMQLVGLTSLLLSSKYEDFWHPRIKDLISISAESYTRNQMLQMEKLILKRLKFQLNEPTPYVFMLRFLKAARSDLKLEHLAFYLIELCLVEYEALKYKPSMLCASVIYVARSSLGMSPAWTPLLLKHTHYEVSNLRECCEMILRFQKAAKRGGLKVIYEKYSGGDLSSVASMKPLDRLPLV